MCTFVGGVGYGEWSNSGNWLNGRIPTAMDDVTFGILAGNNASLANIPGLTLRNLNLEPGYTGMLTLAGNLTVDSLLTQQTGNINVNGNATLRVGRYDLKGGTLTGAGRAEIFCHPGAGNEGFLHLPNAATIGIAAIDLDEDSELTIQAGLTLNATVLTPSGTTFWTGGNIDLRNGARLVNDGEFEIRTDSDFVSTTGNGLVVNSLLMTRTAGNGTTSIVTGFNNLGSGAVVAVETGTLELAGSASSTGNFTVTAGALLTISDELRIDESVEAFSGAGMVKTTGTGKIAVPQGVTATSTAPLHFSVGSDNIIGPGTFKSLTSLLWDNGTINGLTEFVAEGTVTLQGAATKSVVNTTFTNKAVTTWTAGRISLENTLFANHNTFDIRTDEVFVGDESSLFQNVAVGATVGCVEKTLGNGTTDFQLSFESQGVVALQTGTVKFSNGITQSGVQSVTNLNGGTILLGANAEFLLQGGEVRGGGTIDGELRATGGVIHVGDNAASPKLLVKGDYTQTGTATLAVTVQSTAQGLLWGELETLADIALGGNLDFLLPAGGVPVGSAHDIVKWAGTRTGLFGAVAGWTVAYGNNAVTATKN